MSFKFPYLLSFSIHSVQFVLMFTRDNGRENGRTDFLGMIACVRVQLQLLLTFFPFIWEKYKLNGFFEWMSARGRAYKQQSPVVFDLTKWCIEWNGMAIQLSY